MIFPTLVHRVSQNFRALALMDAENQKDASLFRKGNNPSSDSHSETEYEYAKPLEWGIRVHPNEDPSP